MSIKSNSGLGHLSKIKSEDSLIRSDSGVTTGGVSGGDGISRELYVDDEGLMLS